jgi:UDP-N-acetyl-D-mannosaminuronate dehydrogenase
MWSLWTPTPRSCRGSAREGRQAIEPGALAEVHPSVSMISVPTPNDRNGRQDLSFLEAALAAIGPC